MALEKKYNYIIADGNYYVFTSKNGRPILKRINKKLVKAQESLAKELAKKLKDGLDREAVLTEIFMTKYEMKDLTKLAESVLKKKYKPKTRRHHCVDMKVGNHIIPIVD